jgi:hypothetical protein
VLLAGLLCVAGPPAARPVPLLALGAVAVRWGTTSLGAMSGAQSLLGAAGWVGPGLAAASCWCAAAALVVAAPRTPAAIASGVAAGLVIVGPAPAGDAGRVLGRVAAAAVAVVIAIVVSRVVPGRLRIQVAWAASALAVVFAVAA